MKCVKLVSCLLALVLCLGSAGAAENAVTPNSELPMPKFQKNVAVHDPSIIRAEDGYYYIYGSHMAAARSADLIDWEYISRDATNAGCTLVENVQTQMKEALSYAKTNTFWAPDVVQLADGREGYVPAAILDTYYTEPCSQNEETLRKALVDAALLYQGTHYRWGGKSPAGIDCSGLVSMAYLLCGIIIHRDASIEEDFPIKPIELKDIKPGDPIFFPGHVAMYIGDGRYIHSTARAGDNGITFNSLDPDAPDYREDLKNMITQVGSYFA